MVWTYPKVSAHEMGADKDIQSLHEQQADFARVLDEVRNTCAQQRKNVSAFRDHARKARSQCRGLEKPWHRRLVLEKENEAEWWDRRATSCEFATDPKRVEERLAPVIVEAAVIEEREAMERSKRGIAWHLDVPQIPMNKTERVAAEKKQKAKRKKNTALTLNKIGERTLQEFGLEVPKVWEYPDEVCPRCRGAREELPGTSMMWCPVCRIESDVAPDIAVLDSGQRKEKPARYERSEHMLRELAFAQFKESYRVPKSVLVEVAKECVREGVRRDDMEITKFFHMVREMRKTRKAAMEKALEKRKKRRRKTEQKNAKKRRVDRGEQGKHLKRKREESDGEDDEEESDSDSDEVTMPVGPISFRNYYAYSVQMFYRLRRMFPHRLSALGARKFIMVFTVLCSTFDMFKGNRRNFIRYTTAMHDTMNRFAHTEQFGKRERAMYAKMVSFFPLLRGESTIQMHRKILRKMEHFVGIDTRFPGLVIRQDEQDIAKEIREIQMESSALPDVADDEDEE